MKDLAMAKHKRRRSAKISLHSWFKISADDGLLTSQQIADAEADLDRAIRSLVFNGLFSGDILIDEWDTALSNVTRNQ